MKELDEAFDLLHRDAREAPADLSDARARLMAELDNVPSGRPQRRWVVPVAAAAAVVVAAAVVTVRVDWSDEPELPLAAEVLNKAADITAIGAVDKPLGPGQYRYIVIHRWSTFTVPGVIRPAGGRADYPYLREQRIERWSPANPDGVRQETRTNIGLPKYVGTEPPPPGPDGARKEIVADQGTQTSSCTTPVSSVNGRPPWILCDELESLAFYTKKLSGDPDRLYTQLAAMTKNGTPTPSQMFATGIDILGRGLMPATLRAQWYRALAKIPGVTVIDSKITMDGRTGIALGLADERERRELIIDQATGEFIGERTVAGPKPDNPLIRPGTETSQSSITTAVVNKVGQRS